MGEVYGPRDSRFDRDAAIKTSAAQFSERVERETKGVVTLNHPTIAKSATSVRTPRYWSNEGHRIKDRYRRTNRTSGVANHGTLEVARDTRILISDAY